MADAIGKTFVDERIVLDGVVYERCVFRHCVLVFSAQGDVGLHGCEYDRCRWEFGGPALLTVAFLRALDETEGGRRVVERALGRPDAAALPSPSAN